jgi:hypothetical protein
MTFGHAIVFKNVIANEDSISIVLETSKTDQFRNEISNDPCAEYPHLSILA